MRPIRQQQRDAVDHPRLGAFHNAREAKNNLISVPVVIQQLDFLGQPGAIGQNDALNFDPAAGRNGRINLGPFIRCQSNTGDHPRLHSFYQTRELKFGRILVVIVIGQLDLTR